MNSDSDPLLKHKGKRNPDLSGHLTKYLDCIQSGVVDFCFADEKSELVSIRLVNKNQYS